MAQNKIIAMVRNYSNKKMCAQDAKTRRKKNIFQTHKFYNKNRKFRIRLQVIHRHIFFCLHLKEN